MQRQSFVDNTVINHGPSDLLAQLFTEADRAIQDRGITLTLGTVDDLVRANAANRATWLPLFPTFDPRFGGANAANTLCWLGRNREGEVVATQAARVFDWQRTSFHEEAQSLRLLYPEPGRDKCQGEQCVVTAEGCRVITGRAAFIGAMWYRRDVRGLGLPSIMARVARSSAHTVWGTDYAVGMISEGVMQSDLGRKSGHANVDWSVRLTNSLHGDVTFAVVWTDTDELLLDARAFSAQLRRENLDRRGLRSA